MKHGNSRLIDQLVAS